MKINLSNRSAGGLALLVALLCVAATITKISDYPAVTVPATNDLFLLASGATNKNITYANLKAAIGTNGAGTTQYFDYSVVVTQSFKISKGGSLSISNVFTIYTNGVLTLSNLPAPAVLVIGADGNVTNANLAGLTLSGNTLTASGGSVNSTNYRSAVIALTMTGTNVDDNQIDFLKTNQCYRLTLTGNAFFGDKVCTNVPDTNSFQWLQLNLVQDSTGARSVTFTNSIFAGVNGTFFITTNAGAWDSLTLINSPQTNGNVAVLSANNLHR